MCLKKRGVGKKKKKDYKFLAFNLLKKKKTKQQEKQINSRGIFFRKSDITS